MRHCARLGGRCAVVGRGGDREDCLGARVVCVSSSGACAVGAGEALETPRPLGALIDMAEHVGGEAVAAVLIRLDLSGSTATAGGERSPARPAAGVADATAPSSLPNGIV